MIQGTCLGRRIQVLGFLFGMKAVHLIETQHQISGVNISLKTKVD